MIIVSTKAFWTKRADGTTYFIKRGFIGEIPADVANSDIVKLAIKDGSIQVSAKSDKAIEQAIETSETANLLKQKKHEKRTRKEV